MQAWRDKQMLKLTDHGCSKHHQRQLKLSGIEAELMTDILLSFITQPENGNFHTFICEHGHTHRLSFHILVEKWYQSVANCL